MYKYLFITTILLLACKGTEAQSLTVSDLIRVADLSHEKATQFIVNEKKFKLILSHIFFGQMESQYKNEDSKISELLVKHEWQDNRRVINSAHYEFKPQSYTDVLVRQLKDLGFTLKSKVDDKRKHKKVYENNQFMAILYTFEDKELSASIEIHDK